MASDSCADGALCCEGFTCCAGVPVPKGQEYCSPPEQGCPDSDRNLKRDFATVDVDVVLDKVAQLPISSWSYRADEAGTRHVGPMAQDFMAAFQVGGSDRAIHKIDADGVALAAIQALAHRLDEAEKDNAALREELDQVREQLAAAR
jgi:hypothetical protein